MNRAITKRHKQTEEAALAFECLQIFARSKMPLAQRKRVANYIKAFVHRETGASKMHRLTVGS